MAWPGMARRGMDWRGEVWQGKGISKRNPLKRRLNNGSN